MNENNAVVFRRIKGRVIPIRKKAAELAPGAAMLAGGAALAVAGGKVYKTVINKAISGVKKAEAFRSASTLGKTAQLTFDDLLRAKQSNEAINNLYRHAVRLDKASSIVRKGSIVGGAALIAAGSAKLAGSLAKKEDKAKAELLGASAGAAAVTAFTLGMYPKATIQNIAQGRAKTLFNFAKPTVLALLRSKFRI